MKLCEMLEVITRHPIALCRKAWQFDWRGIKTMGIIELLGLATSVSLLSGWRLYLTVFATGIAMYSGYIDLPENLKMLEALGNPWVIGIAGVGAVA